MGAHEEKEGDDIWLECHRTEREDNGSLRTCVEGLVHVEQEGVPGAHMTAPARVGCVVSGHSVWRAGVRWRFEETPWAQGVQDGWGGGVAASQAAFCPHDSKEQKRKPSAAPAYCRPSAASLGCSPPPSHPAASQAGTQSP